MLTQQSRLRWAITFPIAPGLIDALSAVRAPLLFAVRMWASVCLALFVAFWLELDNPYWAGTSAAIVCYPQLGASLRKGWFRMIGTVVGATMIVVLTAWFPQDRMAFLVLLALWCGICAFVGSVLRNFASYSAALAGYTAVIIAADNLGATGGANADVFLLAVWRASEICIGIACAGIVLAGTDLGGARRRLAVSFASLAAEITSRFTRMLALAGPQLPDTQTERRELVRRVIALDPMIDQALGESSYVRYRSSTLQSAVHGLFRALDGWRGVATHLNRSADVADRQSAETILYCIPPELRSVREPGLPARWMADPVALRRACEDAVRRLLVLPTGKPSLRLLADETAKVLGGMMRVLDGLALLVDAPGQLDPRSSGVPTRRTRLVTRSRQCCARIYHNRCGRTLLGRHCLAERRIGDAVRGNLGSIAFAEGRSGLRWFYRVRARHRRRCHLRGAYQIRGAARPRHVSSLLPGPWSLLHTNRFWCGPSPPAGNVRRVHRHGLQFYASPLAHEPDELQHGAILQCALAIVAGCSVAPLAFRLLPLPSPEVRAGRLVALTLRDMRRLAVASLLPRLQDWEGLIYGRLAALPDQAEPLQRGRLLAALSVGTEIIHLRQIVPRLGAAADFDAALEDIARGNSAFAVARLRQLDRRLASSPDTGLESAIGVRARSRILVMSEALSQHASYFDAGATA